MTTGGITGIRMNRTFGARIVGRTFKVTTAALILAGFAGLVAVFVTMLLPRATVPVAEERGHQLPTATEVFQLRSACADLGQKLLEENVVGSALAQDQISHYNPRTNRCYVEVTINTADLTKPMNYFHRVLYDGQTSEMLASAQMRKGSKSGMVFDKQHLTTTLENAGWDDASEYIDAMMADDRK